MRIVGRPAVGEGRPPEDVDKRLDAQAGIGFDRIDDVHPGPFLARVLAGHAGARSGDSPRGCHPDRLYEKGTMAGRGAGRPWEAAILYMTRSSAHGRRRPVLSSL